MNTNTIYNMEPILSQALLSLMDSTGKIKDFVLSELPDVIQQLLLFNRIQITLWTFISIILFIISIVGLFSIFNRKRKDNKIQDNKNCICCSDNNIDTKFVFLLVSSIFGFCFIFIIPHNITTCIKIWVAPKIWLLEYITNIIK